ncbi:hypothetical protein HOA91_00080 [Candidatus Woesearchaeota archaeon]|jgi:hypothetical protein|nr:hypothetical protein [Candidatus Woesearchaeota archaeon]
MAYIRTKKISGNKYAYLVEIISTDKGPRQKVKQYLGRVHDFEKNKEISEINQGNTNKEILLNLIIPELEARGFKEKKNNLVYKNFIFNSEKITLSKKSKNKTNKEAVIGSEEGYLSTFTFQRILNFQKGKDFNKDAHQLAKYFLEAGLQINQELFVKFYQKL